MAILWTILWIGLIAYVGADDTCPSDAEISPCTCDGEGLNCMGARTLDEVKKAFRAKFKYGGVRSVWVQGTPITSLPADVFGNVKSQSFYVEVNNITSADLQAFSGSKKTLQTLSLFGNKISTVNFSPLSSYEVLGTLNLGRNKITSIPDNAISSNSLFSVILAYNQISHIGMNAFSNLPSLGRLELSVNMLKTLGPMSLAMKRHSGSLQINLQANQISSISSSALQGVQPFVVFLPHNQLTSLPFDVFGNLVQRMPQGGFIDVTSNPLSCRGCEYNWIVNNKNVLYNKFVGFTCTDGKGMQDLTKPNIGCMS